MSRRPAPATVVLVAAAMAVAVVACAPVPRTTFPPIGSTPAPVGEATAAAVSQVAAAIAGVGLQASESDRPFRPSEGALLAAAPRTTLRVALPDDPDGAFIVVYALTSPEAAHAAAQDHASFLASATGGRTTYPPGTVFVLRTVGANVVFFSYLPAAAPDARMASIATALATIGDEVPLPA